MVAIIFFFATFMIFGYDMYVNRIGRFTRATFDTGQLFKILFRPTSGLFIETNLNAGRFHETFKIIIY